MQCASAKTGSPHASPSTPSPALTPQRRPRVVSLFSGGGGLDYGFYLAGTEIVLQCEICPHARAVLADNFHNTDCAVDAAKSEGLPPCEIIIAGAPCTDVSVAGKRAGIHGPRSGLIKHVFRLVGLMRRRDRPRYIVLEHVPDLLNWYKGQPPGIGYVVGQLEALGYKSWAHRIVNLAAWGVPHRRRRVLIVASTRADAPALLLDPGRDTCDHHCGNTCYACVKRALDRGDGTVDPRFTKSIVIDTAQKRCPATKLFCSTIKTGSTLLVGMLESPTRGAPDRVGKLAIHHGEALMGLPKDWTAAAGSVTERWHIVGNAVGVPVARWIGERVVQGLSGRLASRGVPSATDTPFTFDAAAATITSRRGTWPRCAWAIRGADGAYTRYATTASEAPVRAPLVPLGVFLTGGLRAFDTAKLFELADRMKADRVDHTQVLTSAKEFGIEKPPSSPPTQRPSPSRRRAGRTRRPTSPSPRSPRRARAKHARAEASRPGPAVKRQRRSARLVAGTAADPVAAAAAANPQTPRPVAQRRSPLPTAANHSRCRPPLVAPAANTARAVRPLSSNLAAVPAPPRPHPFVHHTAADGTSLTRDTPHWCVTLGDAVIILAWWHAHPDVPMNRCWQRATDHVNECRRARASTAGAATAAACPPPTLTSARVYLFAARFTIEFGEDEAGFISPYVRWLERATRAAAPGAWSHYVRVRRFQVQTRGK